MEKYVNEVLQPKIQGDGGWIEFQSFDGKTLTVVFKGECSKCLILHRCVEWIKEQIKTDLKKDVEINAIRKRPYFQDV